MKLTFEDQKTFQIAQGYEEDPQMMSDEAVRETLRYWQSAVDKLVDKPKHADLAYLASFLGALAESDIEYANPYKRFEYGMAFETFHRFTVMAKDKDEADAKAKEKGLAKEDEYRKVADRGCENIYRWDEGYYVYEQYS